MSHLPNKRFGGSGRRCANCLLSLGFTLALAGCAHDVILKPSAGSFVTDANAAMTALSRRYDDIITDLNEQNVRFLTDNPSCGLNTTVRLRTPAADELLHSLAIKDGAHGAAAARADPDKARLAEACLGQAEWAQIDDYLDTHRELNAATIAPERKLLILSRADFDLQLAAVRELSRYVAVLADAADEPDATAAQEIGELSKGILAIGEGAGKLQGALSGGDNMSIGTLFGADGPVASFTGHLAELGAAIELIADQAHDVRTLRTAILGPTGQKVPTLLAGLASDADKWGCIRFQARLGALDAESQRLSPQLPKMTREQRLPIVRDYLQKKGAVPEAQCGSAAKGSVVSPIGQMFAALGEAHADLARIARNDLTDAERRREAAVTMQRLGAAFNAIGSAALVLI